MPGCQADPTIERRVVDGFSFPLGVYPVEPLAPKAGYTVAFEPADGSDSEGDWEEWPDRYVYDIVLSADRMPALFRQILMLLPPRVYPILDILGNDAFREVDPYISYELVGLDRLLDALRQWSDFFYEDGLCGVGAMCEEPFIYAFLDEHKILTVRVEPSMKDRVDRLLAAFDLEPCEDPAGADAAAHEHRGVLVTPDDRPELLGPEEIIEDLRAGWRLVLNVDPDRNLDDEGNELGVTPWRCVARCEWENPDATSTVRYAELIVMADCLTQAELRAIEAAQGLSENEEETFDDVSFVIADRLTPEQLAKIEKRQRRKREPSDLIRQARWLD